MLCNYVKLYRTSRLPRWRVRLVSTEVQALENQRERGRPKADGDVTKKQVVSRKRRGSPDSIKEDGAVARGEDVKADRKLSSNVADPRTNAAIPQDEVPSSKTPKIKRTRTTMKKLLRIYARLAVPSSKHYDLASFLKYATKVNLNPNTNVYKGTRYEYQVVDALKRYNFSLVRIGRSNDLGIDLIGTWKLPGSTKQQPIELPVIVQCKASKAGPKMIREVESAPAGAPAGWRGDEAFRLLVANGKSTPGVLSALQRSRYPMGYMQMTLDGKLKQCRWNDVATQAGLQGMGTTVKYNGSISAPKDSQGKEARASEEIIALTWMDGVWRPKESKAAKKTAKPKK